MDDECLLLNTEGDEDVAEGNEQEFMKAYRGNDDSMILNLLDDAMNEDDFASLIG